MAITLILAIIGLEVSSYDYGVSCTGWSVSVIAAWPDISDTMANSRLKLHRVMTNGEVKMWFPEYCLHKCSD